MCAPPCCIVMIPPCALWCVRMASFRSIVSGRQVWNGEDVANGRSAGISLNHIFSAKTMKTERLKHEDKILKSSRHPKQCKQKDTCLRLSFTMKSIPSLTWALARKRPCKNHGKASSARRLPLEADDFGVFVGRICVTCIHRFFPWWWRAFLFNHRMADGLTFSLPLDMSTLSWEW